MGVVNKVVIRDQLVYIDHKYLGGEVKNVDVKYEDILKIDKEKEDTDIQEEEGNSDEKEYKWKHRNIVSVNQFSRDDLRQLFKRAGSLMQERKCDALKGKTIAMFFKEPSTRTECSFTGAIQRLGGSIIKIDCANSSLQKGESVGDTVRCLEQYCDGIIVRGKNGIIEECKSSMNIINAGEGSGEHPTQALLDLFTIREERGSITGATITICGDLLNGRTVHSLVKLLCLYRIRQIYYIPAINVTHNVRLDLPSEIYEYVESFGIKQEIINSLEEVIEKTDVLYMTRIQKERDIGGEDNEYIYEKITPYKIANAKSSMIIMHPLPRNDEIDVDMDGDPRAVYFRQMKYGMYVRMALLELLY